jgi:hypothetical protein
MPIFSTTFPLNYDKRYLLDLQVATVGSIAARWVQKRGEVVLVVLDEYLERERE